MKKVLTGIALAAVGSIQLSAQGQQYLQLTSPTGEIYILRAPATGTPSPIILDLPTTSGTLVGTPDGVPLTPNAPVRTNASGELITGPLLLGTEVSGILLPLNGGTGVDGSTASNGQLLIGNGAGFTLANITGTGAITVTNGPGTIDISFTGPTGSGTTNFLPLWSSSNTLTNSILQQDGGATTATIGGSLTVRNDVTIQSDMADNSTRVRIRAGSSQGTDDVFLVETESGNNIFRARVQSGYARGILGGTATPGELRLYNGGGASNGVGILRYETSATVDRIFNLPNVNATGTVAIAQGQGTAGQVLTSGGANQLATWQTSYAPAAGTTPNSTLRWNGSAWVENTGVLADASGNLGTTGSISSTTFLAAGTTLAVTGLSSLNGGVTVTGTTTLDASLNGPLRATAGVVSSSAIGLATSDVTGILPVGNGGTGVDASAATDGQLLIGNGTGFTLGTITGGTGITITNGPGTIDVAFNGLMLPTAVTNDATLRWDGSAWVENANVLADATGNLSATGNVTATDVSATGALSAGTTLSVTGASSLNGGATVTGNTSTTTLNVSGTTTLDATLNGPLRATAGVVSSSAIGLATSDVTGILPVGNGGTGVDASAATDGQLLIGNGTGFTLSTITGGTGITITNGPGTIDVAFNGLMLPTAVTNDATLRWDGSAWVENANVLADATGNLSATGNVTATDVSATGALSAGTTLSVTGASSLNGGVTVTGDASVSNDLTVTNNASVGNDLSVSGNTTLSDTVSVPGIATGSSNDFVVRDANNNLAIRTIPNIITGTGTAQTLPIWADDSTQTNSIVTQDAGNTMIEVGGSAQINGDADITGDLYVGLLDGPLRGNLGAITAGAIDLASADVTGILPVANGGTGVDASAATDGQLLIGNGTGFTLSNVTGSGNITITNGPGTIDVSYTGLTLPTAVTNDATLRWNGTAWVENANVLADATGNLSATGNIDATGSLSAGTTLAVTGAASLNGGATVTGNTSTTTLNVTGTTTLDATLNGPLRATAGVVSSSAIGLASADVTGILPVGNGGTGVDASAATDGQLLIGNGTGFTLSNVTGSGNITITNGPGTIDVSYTGLTLPTAVTNDATLRWNGTAWVENANVLADATGNLSATGNVSATDVSATGALSAGTTLTVTGAATLNGGATVTGNTSTTTLNVTGTTTLDATLNGPLRATAGVVSSSAIGLASADVTGILPVGNGGTGVDASAATDGQLLIGNGTGFTLSNVTGGTGITITNGPGTIDVAFNGLMLPTGGTMGSTLRWDGSAWVNNDSLLADGLGNLSAAGDIAADGALSAGTTLSVTGAASLNGGVTVTGNASLNNDLTVTGTTTLNGATVSIPNVAAGSSNDFVVRSGNDLAIRTIPNIMTGTGTANTIPIWADDSTQTNSIVTQDAGNTMIEVAGSAQINGDVDVTGDLYVGLLDGPLRGNLGFITAGAIDLASSDVTGMLATANGGTGVDASAATDGQLLIGNGTGFTLGNVTGSAGITITNGPGTIDVSYSGALLPNGTTNDATLRWNGTAWVENTGVLADASGNLGTTGNITATGSLAAGTTLGVTGLASLNGGVTVNGTTTLDASLTGPLRATAGVVSAGAIDLATEVTGTLGIANGGTGVNTAATDGQLLIGNGTGFTLATLTEGTGIDITNSAGGITIAFDGLTLPMPQTLDATLRWNGTAWVDNADVLADASGNLIVNGNVSAGTMDVAGLALLDGGVTVTGTTTLDASLTGPLRALAGVVSAGSIDLATEVTNTLGVANGGTGVDGSAAPAGSLLIGNGTGFTLATLTEGSGIDITNTAGGITIAFDGLTLPLAANTDATLRWNGTAWVENAGVLASASGNLDILGNVTSNGWLVAGTTLGVTGLASLNGGVTVTGTTTLDASLTGPLRATAGVVSAGNIDLTSEITGILGIANGGTGVSTTATNGQLLIGNGSGYTLANITGSNGITITDGAGSINVSYTGLALPTGTTSDATLRWDGSAWVENASLLASSTGVITSSAMAGAAVNTPIAANEGLVVADANGTLTKRNVLAALGMTVGTYTNVTANPEGSVQITGLTITANAKVFITGVNLTVTPGYSSNYYVSAQDLTSFTVTFGGELQPGESFNYMIVAP